MGTRRPAPANQEAQERMAHADARRRIRAGSAFGASTPEPAGFVANDSAAVLIDASNIDAMLELGVSRGAHRNDVVASEPPSASTAARLSSVTCSDAWEFVLAQSLGLLADREVNPADADLADEHEIEEGILLPREGPAVETPDGADEFDAADENGDTE